MIPKKPVPQRKTDFAHRVADAQAALTATSNRWESMPYSAWLREMADRRRAVAALYRAASHGVGPDTAEWHAFIDAALLLEMQAVTNDNSAIEHEATRLTVVGGTQ